MRSQTLAENYKKRGKSFFRSASVPLASLPRSQVGKVQIAHPALMLERNSNSKFRAIAQFRITI
jgi:hypothetical protein